MRQRLTPILFSASMAAVLCGNPAVASGDAPDDLTAAVLKGSELRLTSQPDSPTLQVFLKEGEKITILKASTTGSVYVKDLADPMIQGWADWSTLDTTTLNARQDAADFKKGQTAMVITGTDLDTASSPDAPTVAPGATVEILGLSIARGLDCRQFPVRVLTNPDKSNHGAVAKTTTGWLDMKVMKMSLPVQPEAALETDTSKTAAEETDRQTILQLRQKVLQTQHQKALDAIQPAHDTAIKALQDKLKTDMDAATAAAEKLRTELKARQAKETAALPGTVQKSLTDMRAHYRVSLAAIVNDSALKDEEFEKKKNALDDQYQKDLKAATDPLDVKKKALDETFDKEDKEKIQAPLDATLKELKDQCDAETKKIEDPYAEKIKALDEKSSADLKNIQALVDASTKALATLTAKEAGPK